MSAFGSSPDREAVGRPGPTISFVIPVRNDARHLGECLRSISRNQHHGCEIVVADNGSTDGSDRVATESRARLLELPGLRASELRNRAAEAASGQVLAFVDADHEIGSDWVRSALETLQLPGVAAVGAPYDAPEDGTWVQRTYDGLRERRPGRRDVEWLGSGNLAVWREPFERIGGFDTTLETCEDVDLCRRLRSAGLRVMSDERLKSVHKGDPATLRALFFGELWRGRDNLRASFRRPFSLRSLPSIAIPIFDLACLALAGAGIVAAAADGLVLTLVGISGISTFAMLRAFRILANRGVGTLRLGGQAFAVALVYDVARALALVLRVTHRGRRGASSA